MKFLKRIFHFLFNSDNTVCVAHNLYWQIVSVSRNPEIYQRFSVPDTLDGRFDCLMIHLFVVIERLEKISEHKIATHLLDFFVKDMDRSLRETGVGDPSISRKMRKIGEAYLGRMNVYGLVFDKNIKDDIQSAVYKNLYRLADVPNSALEGFTDYICNYRQALQNFIPTHELVKPVIQMHHLTEPL